MVQVVESLPHMRKVLASVLNTVYILCNGACMEFQHFGRSSLTTTYVCLSIYLSIYRL